MEKQSQSFVEETENRSRRAAGEEDYEESGHTGADSTQTGGEEEGLQHYRQAVPLRVEEPFDSPEWIFEIVEGGLPLLALRTSAGVMLWTGRRRDLSRFFPEITEALESLPEGTVLDAELVGLRDMDEPHRRLGFTDREIDESTRNSGLLLVIHDVLSWRGTDVTNRTLGARRNLLESIAAGFEGTRLQLSEQVEERGIELFEIASRGSFPSLRAKLKGSTYPLSASSSWAVIPIARWDLMVVGGYIDGGNSLALLTGSFEGPDLLFRRRVPVPLDMRRKLYPLTRKASPFHAALPWQIGTHWTTPELVVELRNGRFLRLRPDLDPKSLPGVEVRQRGQRALGKRGTDRAEAQRRIRFSA